MDRESELLTISDTQFFMIADLTSINFSNSTSIFSISAVIKSLVTALLESINQNVYN